METVVMISVKIVIISQSSQGSASQGNKNEQLHFVNRQDRKSILPAGIESEAIIIGYTYPIIVCSAHCPGCVVWNERQKQTKAYLSPSCFYELSTKASISTSGLKVGHKET